MRKFDGKELLIATHNAGKAQEISVLLEEYIERYNSAGDLGLAEPEETGATFVENALIKARAAAQASGMVSLADDSGLAVNALDGEPGIYSARWAGPEKDFSMAMEKVHTELGDTPDRSATFVCVLALCWPDEHTEVFEGHVDGRIIWPARGEKGFGYDPIFVPEGYDITFAEMEPAQKHKISHRADAFAKLVAGCFKK